jgi:hypothetical protein
MARLARNLTDNVDGFLCDMKYLILDNDRLFTAKFCGILKDAGVKVVRTAIQAPNMNAVAERWVQTVKHVDGGVNPPDSGGQATILHLLDIDHERLTYRFQGRDRLTDVHGQVIRGVLR